MDIASGIAEIKALQGTLHALTALSLTSYRFPQSATITDELNCDFIIVGGGTAGSVVANRLSENPDYEVCLMEAGEDPPLESILPGLVGLQPRTAFDYNMTSVNDGYADQYQQNSIAELSFGKMLGGTSSLDHFMMTRGSPYDYSSWGSEDSNSSWTYEGLLPYFIKSEKLEDEEILNSVYGKFHGSEGYLRMKREPNKNNVPVLDAFSELGYDTPIDINNPNVTLGYTEAILTTADGIRQSAAIAYLSSILNRTNLHVFKNTKVEQIIFDSNNAATGVRVVTSNETIATVNAKKEVILSAGAVHTPQLLMLSGVGNKTHLESFNIPVISDLPVGQNLLDNPVAIMVYKMQATNASTPVSNPHEIPIPTVMGLAALNESQDYPDYVSFNVYFPHDSSSMIQFCSNAFKYNDDVCQVFYDAGKGRETLLVGISALHPSSRGYILLKSTDHADDPLVYLQKFTDENDLVDMGKYFLHYTEVEKTNYFKSIGAEFVDLELPECSNLDHGSEEFWQCYALSMSSTIWNFCGTCSIGTVVDTRLNVNGVSRVRVVDACVMPSLAGAKIIATVYAVAEKASDMIKEDWESSY